MGLEILDYQFDRILFVKVVKDQQIFKGKRNKFQFLMEVPHGRVTETGVLTTIFGGQLPQPSLLYSTSRATTRVSGACAAEWVSEG